MLATIRHFLSLIRFSHTLFALPFAVLAAMMAWRMQALELPTSAMGPYGPESFATGAEAEASSALHHDSYMTIAGLSIPWD